MHIWDYKVINYRRPVQLTEAPRTEDGAVAEILDGYGAEGWELVSVAHQSYRREYDPSSLYGLTCLSFYMKRARATS